MFKLRYNNNINESFEKEIDARLEALNTFKKNNNLKLIEVLNEDDEVIFSKEREIETPEVELPTEEEVTNGTNSLLRGLLSRVWETIDDYNSAIITINTEKPEDSETINKLQSIIDDLNIHVGILESCLDE